ncbi:hypothetical protein NC996_21110 [Trichocoleus sp. ST-U2]|uniref:hypothetical protein n=1 Tax=Coleofasciculus sp. FACHB-SPT9 TaxID=2692791 RepID=UPI001685945F|nr:hypothetical protein [Coleofasciculus sp. FACHB-SPT9]MBD1890603.1 hypothetical protein [Coleofasciculus sp. FACHB-SPT9]
MLGVVVLSAYREFEQRVWLVTSVMLCDTMAKWLNYDKSQRRSWTDVPIVLQLQDLQSEYSEIYQQEKQQLTQKKWKHKKLTHEEARQAVQYIQSLCAPNYGKHNQQTGEFLSHGTRRLFCALSSRGSTEGRRSRRRSSS